MENKRIVSYNLAMMQKKYITPIKIIAPAVCAILLFVSTLYCVIIPKYSESLEKQKRENLKDQIHLTWGILDYYHNQEKKKVLTRDQAQKNAVLNIRNLRYGSQEKDYFWIHTDKAMLLLHPYRIDLEGNDVSGLVDPEGTYFIQKFIEICSKNDEGYVKYLWQWQDDRNKIVPKISYVKLFAPWKWIVGTGAYVEDIRIEVKNMSRYIVITSAIITLLIILLMLYIILNNVNVETKRRQVENENKEMQVKIVHASKMASQGEMAGGVAHEINNPLAIISGYVQTIKRRLRKPPLDLKEISEYIDDMEETIDRIVNIIKGLLLFSRNVEKEIPKVESLCEIISNSTSLCTEKFKYEGIQLSINNVDNSVKIKCNKTNLIQLFLNLLNNAFDAIKSEKIKKIIIDVNTDDVETIVIRISNTGIPIPKKFRNKIFEPFFTTKPVGRGTGLGLSICRGIIESHNGSFSVDDQSEETCFVIVLPKYLGK